MARFFPYLGIALALVVAALAWAFSGDTIVRAPVVPQASSTIAVIDSAASAEPAAAPAVEMPAAEPEPAAPESSTPVEEESVAAETPEPASVAPAASVAAPIETPASSPETSGNVGLDAAAATLRGALVNILCYAPSGSRIRSITGSGIFIDEKGFILTNAHIGQYLLLADRGVSCFIRSGSPAVNRYVAALAYISPLWLRANPTVLTETLPTGTGEYDFAILAVTRSATSDPLPASFPAIPLAQVPPAAGTPVVIASYGAQFLEAAQVQSALSPTVVFGSIKDIFTFDTTTIDVIALGGSAAAQEGSSGGGVAGASGELLGVITTSTVEGSTDTRSLAGITASYIRAEYASEMGSALDLLLAEEPSYAAADFAPQIPTLEAIITANL